MTRRLRMLRHDDGSMLPMVIVFAALGLLVVLVVTAATSLFLERKRLLTLADGAALVGAEAFELSAVDAGGDGPRALLADHDIASAVSAYLTSYPGTQLDGVRLERAFTPDGRSATVALSSAWRPPVVTLFVPEGIRLDATSTARSVFG